jgi:hypothetical protein
MITSFIIRYLGSKLQNRFLGRLSEKSTILPNDEKGISQY